jgi:hypothetical protein
MGQTLTRLVSAATSWRVEISLLVVSNTFLALAFILLANYSCIRDGPALPSNAGWTLLAFGLWPSTFFLRLAYAESLFLCTALLTLIGMHRRWPLVAVAFLAGLATATRPVGVAVTAAFLWYVVRRPQKRLGVRLGQAVLLAPIACWGLLNYMFFLYMTFGNPLAFAQTQEHWTHRAPVAQPGLTEKLWALLTMEPILSVYDPQSSRFWGQGSSSDGVLFNLYFWNPTLFLVTAGLVAWGAWRKWLSGPETVLGAALLAIPYLTRAYEMSMASHARFAAAVVVIYPVLGRLLASLPPAAAAAAVCLSGALMLCWTALYTAGYLFF